MDQIVKENQQYKEVNQDEFISEVIEASKEKLIVVDFWAPWCGPCKDLGPRIEKIVGQTNNKASLIKINIDNNQELAKQLQIQSIPTVYAFKDGKIANAFKGSLPESEIIKFIEKALGEKLQNNYLEIIKNARNLLNNKQYQDCIQLVEEIIGSESKNSEAIEIYIKGLIGLGELDTAKETIDSLDDETLKNGSIKSAVSAYKLSTNAKKYSSDKELIDMIEKDPKNIDCNKQLSDFYFQEKEYKKSFSLMIDLFKKVNKENKTVVKKILFEYFEILGETHEETKEARRKLSSIIFS